MCDTLGELGLRCISSIEVRKLLLHACMVFVLRLVILEIVHIFVGCDFPILSCSVTYTVLVFTSVLYLWDINISVFSGSQLPVLRT